MREEMEQEKPNRWRHSPLFEDVEVALEYDLILSDYWLLPERDRAYMIARKRTKGTMEAWENHLQVKKMEQEKAKSKPPSKGKR